MSLVDKIYLASVVAVFTAFPTLLLWVWVMTKGWRYDPVEPNPSLSGEQTTGDQRVA